MGCSPTYKGNIKDDNKKGNSNKTKTIFDKVKSDSKSKDGNIKENSKKFVDTFKPIKIKQDLDDFLTKNQSISKKPVIISADYGDFQSNKLVNVIEKVRSKIKEDGSLTILANNQIIGDPAPGYPKILKVVFKKSENEIPITILTKEGSYLRINCNDSSDWDFIKIALNTTYERRPVLNEYHTVTIIKDNENSHFLKYSLKNGYNWNLIPQPQFDSDSIMLKTDATCPYGEGNDVTLFSDRYIFLGETFYAIKSEEFQIKFDEEQKKSEIEKDKKKEAQEKALKKINDDKILLIEKSGILLSQNSNEFFNLFKINENSDFNEAYNKFSFMFQIMFQASNITLEEKINFVDEMGKSGSLIYDFRLQHAILGLLGNEYSSKLQSSTSKWVLFNSDVLYQLVFCGEFIPDQILSRKNIKIAKPYHSLEYANSHPDSDFNITSSQRYWYNVLTILDNISKINKIVKKNQNSVEARLACSVAIHFGTPNDVAKDWIGYPSCEKIKPIDRFNRFLKVYKEGKLMPCFSSLSTWHLGFIANSFRTDEELDWCLEADNIPSNFKSSQNKISDAGGLVVYRDKNENGVDIDEGGEKYYGVEQTSLYNYKETGGVCGAISFFASAACQAFGVPAILAGQPGHCAFLWLNTEGKFLIGNDISGWEKTEINSNYAWLYELMSDCQYNREKFIKSENLRLASFISITSNPQIANNLVKLASEECVSNVKAWIDRVSTLNKISILGEGLKNTFYLNLNSIKKYKNNNTYTIDLKNSKISSGELISNLVEIRKITIYWCDSNGNNSNLQSNTKYILSTSVDGQSFTERRTNYHERFCDKDIYPIGYKLLCQKKSLVFYQPNYDQSVIPGWSKGKPDTRFLKIELLDEKFSDIKNIDITLSIKGADLKKESETLFSFWNNDKKVPQESFKSKEQKKESPSNMDDNEKTDIALFCKTKLPVNSVEERKDCLTDGTGDNCWTTSENNADIEIDLGTQCDVTEIRIKWWASCHSDNYKIFTCLKDGSNLQERASCHDCIDPNNWNAYSTMQLSKTKKFDTQIIKLSLKDGHDDPWQQKKLLGIRSVNVYGSYKVSPPPLSKEAIIINNSISVFLKTEERAYKCLSNHLKSFIPNIFAGYEY